MCAVRAVLACAPLSGLWSANSQECNIPGGSGALLRDRTGIVRRQLQASILDQSGSPDFCCFKVSGLDEFIDPGPTEASDSNSGRYTHDARPLTPFSFETGFDIATHRRLANARINIYQIANA